MIYRSALLIALALVFVSNCLASTISSLDDIEYWIGSGANRAGIAIDWDGDNNQPGATSLVWGYRWDGAATGEDMLRAVLADDMRLYAKLSAGGSLGIAVYGIGRDDNNDGAFEIEDGTQFGPDGVAVTGLPPGVSSLNPADRYVEGWQFGFWHYGVAAGPSPSGWASSTIGPTSRVLNDGMWDSYAFSPTFSLTAFADQLLAAPATTSPGDFNGDGTVDAGDYTVWRDTMGDAASYNLWITNYGGQQNSSALPEPAAVQLLSICLILMSHLPVRFRSGDRAK